MEKISCICKMRQLYQAICRLETDLVELYGVTLNEAMVMCCIGHERPHGEGDCSERRYEGVASVEGVAFD